jgi:hypothetical protein
MVGYPSKKPKLSFVDDPGKLYRQRRHVTQAKGLETLDPKAKVEGPSESPPPSPKEDQPQSPPMGEQPQPERKIELCTPDIVDLPIINLQDVGRPFQIKVSTICMTIVGALDNLLGARWVTNKNFRDNPKVPRWRRLLKLIQERWRITLRRP